MSEEMPMRRPGLRTTQDHGDAGCNRLAHPPFERESSCNWGMRGYV
jgi:hypothetical protein